MCPAAVFQTRQTDPNRILVTAFTGLAVKASVRAKPITTLNGDRSQNDQDGEVVQAL